MKSIYLIVQLTFLLVGPLALPATALAESNQMLTYQGRILRPDGTPVEGSIRFTVKVQSPSPTLCNLWTERQTVNVVKGVFSLQLGRTANRLTGAQSGAANTFNQAFINNPAVNFTNADCANGSTFSPSLGEDRNMSVTFEDNGAEIKIVEMPIKAVPFAMQAEQVGGYSVNYLFKIAGASQNGDKTTGLYSQAGANLLWDLAHDRSMGGNILHNVADPAVGTDAATKAYVDSAVTGMGSTAISDVLGTSPIEVATTGTTRTIALGTSGVAAATYGTTLMIPRITVDAFGRITFAEEQAIPMASSTAPGLVQIDTSNGLTVSGGTLGLNITSLDGSNFGSQTQNTVFAAPTTANGNPTFRLLDQTDIPTLTTAGKVENSATTATAVSTPDAIIARDASGNFAANQGTLTAVNIDNGFGSAVSITVPAGLTPYNLVLPPAAGNADDILTVDALGNLGWKSAAASGSVTLVDMAMPPELSVTGGPITAGAGTLSAAWNTQAQNLVFASPTGAVGTPGFRALEASDIPALDASKITSGTFGVERGGTGLVPAVGNANQVYGVNAAGTAAEFKTITAGTGVTVDLSTPGAISISAQGTGGTVTNIGLTAPTSVFTVTGSPVTGAGTMDISFADQMAATFFAAPTGSSGAPSFRTLAGSDLPVYAGTGVTVSLTSGSLQISALGSGGTVTEITAATGLLGGVITGIGTVSVDVGLTAGQIVQVGAGDKIPVALIPNLDTSILTTGILGVDRGGTGLVPSGIADANRIYGINATGTNSEFKSVVAGTGVTLDFSSPGTISISALGSGGTVTEVGASVPAYMTVSPASITTSGTLDFSFNSQNAGFVFAAPTGASGVPTFRALTSFDIPFLDAAHITTGTLPVSRGGTGVGSFTPYALLAANMTGDAIEQRTCAVGQFLVWDVTTGWICQGLAAGTGVSITNTAGTFSISTTLAGGTVTNVGLMAPTSVFSVTGSPVTGAGTMVVDFAQQGPATVFAAPTGSTGIPTFRALASEDLPSIDASKITGTLGVNHGGTGLVPTAGNANQVYGVNAAGNAAEFKSLVAGTGLSINYTAGTISLSVGSSGVGQWQDNARGINYSAGSVGIGTNTPYAPFEVRSANATINLSSSAASLGSNLSAGVSIRDNVNVGVGFFGYSNTQDLMIHNTQAGIALGTGTLSYSLWVDPSGNIGVGTDSPAVALDINATGSMGSAIRIPRGLTGARPAGDIGMIRYNTTLNKYEVYEGGVGWMSLATSSGTSSTSQWQNNASGIHYSGGSVGIGTSSPAAALDLSGGTLALNGANGAKLYGNSLGALSIDTDNSGGALRYVDKNRIEFSNQIILTSEGGNPIRLTTGTLETLRAIDGKVGIGTSNPRSALHVEGAAEVRGGGFLTLLGADPLAPVAAPFINAKVATGFSTQPAYSFWYQDGTGLSNPAAGEMGIVTNSTERLRFNLDGRIGIGTIAASAGLDVATTGTLGSAIRIPRDSTTMRPAGAVGMLRYNTTDNKYEVYETTGWASLSTSTGTAGLSQWTNITDGIRYNSGSVAIGTNNPTTTLQVHGGSNTDPLRVSSTGTGSFITFSDGTTATMPSIGARGDDFLIVLTSERLRIKANGLIGIGTNTPTAALDIATTGTLGSAIRIPRDTEATRPTGANAAALQGMMRYNTTANKYEVYEGTIGWTSLATGSIATSQWANNANGINYNSGSVGIGTATPTMELDVVGQIVASGRIRSTNGGLTAQRGTSVTLSGPVVNLQRARTTGTLFGSVASGDTLGTVQYGGHNGTAFTEGTNGGAAISAVTTQAWTAANNGTELQFATTPNNTAASVLRMTIAQSGQVAIGPAGPAAGTILDIIASGANSTIRLPNGDTTNRPTTGLTGMIRYNTSLSKYEVYEAAGWASLSTSSGTTGLSQWSDNPNGIHYSSGSVGIGTFPYYKLQVTAAEMAGLFENYLDDDSTAPVLGLARTKISAAPPAGGFGASLHMNLEGFTNNSTTTAGAFSTIWENNQTDNTTSRNAAILFSTTSGATLAERMRISSHGRLGIGTQTPLVALDINATGSMGSAIRIPRADTSARPSGAIGMMRYNTDLNKYEVYEGTTGWMLISTASGTSGASQWTNNSNGINYSSGSVGIGISVPTANLEVASTANSVLKMTSDTDSSAGGPKSWTFTTQEAGGMVLTSPAPGNWLTLKPATAGTAAVESGILLTNNAENRSWFLHQRQSDGNSFWLEHNDGAGFYVPFKVTSSGGIESRGRTDNIMMLEASGAGRDAGIVFAGSPSLADAYIFMDDDDSQKMKFGISNSWSSGTDRNTNTKMTLTQGGFLGIGTTAPTVALDITTGTLGSAIRIPRADTASRPAGTLATDLQGMMRYNTSLNKYEVYEGTAGWMSIATSAGSAGASQWVAATNGIAYTAGSVGIGIANPGNRLTVPWNSGDTSSTAYFGLNSASNSQIAVEAVSYSNFGVQGSSAQAAGGAFFSQTGIGLYGKSVTGDGLYATSDSGTSARFIANLATNTSPTLIVQQSGTSGAALQQWQAANGTPVAGVTAEGKLGVGTSAPAVDIQVLRNLAEAKIEARVNSQSSGTHFPALLATAIGNNAGGFMQFNRLRGTDASRLPVQANDALGTIQFQGYGTSSYTEGARIVAGAEANFTNTSSPTNLTFMTAPSGSIAATERMRISAAGNVGIGATSPTAILDVAATGTNSAIRIPRADNSNRPTGAAATDLQGMMRYNTSNNKYEVYEGTAGWLNLATGSTGASQWSNNSLGINYSSGSVGINTASPAATLDVTGSFRSQSSLVVWDFGNAVSTIRGRNNTNGVAILDVIAGTATFEKTGVIKQTLTEMTIGTGSENGGSPIRFQTNAQVQMSILDNGRVGIGTTSPTAAFEVAATGTTSAIRIPRADDSNRPTGANAAALQGMMRYNTSINKYEVYEGTIGWMSLSTSNGTSSASQWTNVTGGVAYPSGSVGVGTSTLAGELTVGGSDSNISIELGPSTASNAGAGLYLKSKNSGTENLAAVLAGNGGDLQMVTTNTTPMKFGSWANRNMMTLDTATGRFGIGTITPTVGLDIATTGTTGSAIRIPRDTEALRPVGSSAADLQGMMRYNTTSNKYEVYEGTTGWANLSTGTTGVSQWVTVARGINYPAGSVGIGVNTPTMALEIADPDYWAPSATMGNFGLYTVASMAVDRGAMMTLGGRSGSGMGTSTYASIAGRKENATLGDNAGYYSIFTRNSSTGMNEHFRINSGGSIGVGTTTPLEKLHVEGNLQIPYGNYLKSGLASYPNRNMIGTYYDGTFDLLRLAPAGQSQSMIQFMTAATGGGTAQTRMTIAESGNVGINTSTLYKKFEVTTNGSNDGIRINGSYNDSDSIDLQFHRTRGTASSKTAVQNGDEVWNILSTAQATGGGDSWVSALVSYVDGAPSSSSVPGALQFYTNTAGGNWGPRVTLRANGQLGIGTDSPVAALDIESNGTLGSAIRIPRDTTALRPSAASNGMMRYNTNNNKFEVYEANNWVNMVTGSGGSGLPAPSGTAALPSISFVNDLDTGLYNPGANTLGISTGGSLKWNINDKIESATAGGARVSNTSADPQAPTFSFNGNSTTGMYASAANTLAFSTAGTMAMRILPNGNMVFGNSAFTPYAGDKYTLLGGRLSIYHDTWNDLANGVVSNSANANIYTLRARGTLTSLTYPQTGDVLGQFQMRNHTSDWGAGISSAATVNHTSGNAGANLIFNTVTDSGTFMEAGRFNSGGSLGIGVINPTARLHVSGDVLATAYLYSSDARLKKDVVPVEGLAKILQLAGKRFKWIDNNRSDVGLIAQEVETVFPELVHTSSVDGKKSVQYGNLVAPLIEATKELYGMCEATQAQMDAIAAQTQKNTRDIASIKAENEDLKDRVDRLEKLVEQLIQEKSGK